MGEKVNLGEAEIIAQDIVDLDVLPLEEDNLITKIAEKTVVKEDKKAKAEQEKETEEVETEEEVDETEESEEETKEEEIPEEEKESEKKEKQPEDKAKYVEIDREVSLIQRDLKDVSNTLKTIAESIPEAPVRPGDTEDEEAMAQYRVDMAVYKSQMQQFKAQQNSARGKTKDLALRQESLFRDKHKTEDLGGFEKWMAESIELQTAFYTGGRTLETLYKWYKVEKGEPEKEIKELKQLKKKGGKFEPISTKSKGGSPAEVGGNGFDSKYKFANLPMFKDLVKQYKGKASLITGEKYTQKYIDEICKQEYKLSKGLSVI